MVVMDLLGLTETLEVQEVEVLVITQEQLEVRVPREVMAELVLIRMVLVVEEVILDLEQLVQVIMEVMVVMELRILFPVHLRIMLEEVVVEARMVLVLVD